MKKIVLFSLITIMCSVIITKTNAMEPIDCKKFETKEQCADAINESYRQFVYSTINKIETERRQNTNASADTSYQWRMIALLNSLPKK